MRFRLPLMTVLVVALTASAHAIEFQGGILGKLQEHCRGHHAAPEPAPAPEPCPACEPAPEPEPAPCQACEPAPEPEPAPAPCPCQAAAATEAPAAEVAPEDMVPGVEYNVRIISDEVVTSEAAVAAPMMEPTPAPTATMAPGIEYDVKIISDEVVQSYQLLESTPTPAK